MTELEDLNTLFTNQNTEKIIEIIKTDINIARSINDIKSKKKLKELFPFLLDYITNMDAKDINNFIFQFNYVLLDLALMNPDILNEFFRIYLTEFHRIINEDEDFMEHSGKIINTSILIVYLTNNLHQTNQFLANYIHLMNLYISKINTTKVAEEEEGEQEEEEEEEETMNVNNFAIKCLLIKNLQLLCHNIKSYNPFLINQILTSLSLFNDFEYQKSDIKLSDIINVDNESDNNTDNDKTLSHCCDLILTAIDDLMNSLKDDICFDTIFKEIISTLDLKFKDKNIPLVQDIINFYNLRKVLITTKKNIQINFLTIKRKPIPSLEPEIETNKDKDMPKILEKKLRKTKKQAIRNLKKEAIVIDVQRQKTLHRQYDKRKEEQKISNQFIEQSKVEYKKLITSQDKKRYKLKSKRK
jgi:hypothetical protein